MSNTPSLPKGTRDFSPEIMVRRNYIISAIKETFEKFGFQPLETPAMENLSVLTGKYGDEGDQLLYKILNSGNYLKNVNTQEVEDGELKTITPKIAEKGLRYDLTVPFARFVATNRHQLTMPFKRYQIQPVWRADRPQKGRYREFLQCDADVVGTESLLCEIEIIWMISEVFDKLGIKDYTIKINHRKVLEGIVQSLNRPNDLSSFSQAIDKLDKIGNEKVAEELITKGFTSAEIDSGFALISTEGTNEEKLSSLNSQLKSKSGKEGIEKLSYITEKAKCQNVEFDPKLARGLSYYTGAIFEVKINGIQMGSVSGGGRYDDLTGIFGAESTPGIGFSFGIDRVYDSMEELGLFETITSTTAQVLIVSFDSRTFDFSLEILQKLRAANISSELYPDPVKLKKQLQYGNRKGIPFVILIGEDEMGSGKLKFKDMINGGEENLTIAEIVQKLK